MKTGAIGFIFIAILSMIISKLIIKPIENLSKASKHIAIGNYENRAQVITKDEIGTLAIQFNLMAEEIEKKIHELEEEGQRKQRFIDNLTHELRTPLTSIIGYSDILSNIKYDEKNFNKGLGLSICDEIIKRHNGKLEINSKLCQGTTVRIYFKKEVNGK